MVFRCTSEWSSSTNLNSSIWHLRPGWLTTNRYIVSSEEKQGKANSKTIFFFRIYIFRLCIFLYWSNKVSAKIFATPIIVNITAGLSTYMQTIPQKKKYKQSLVVIQSNWNKLFFQLQNVLKFVLLMFICWMFSDLDQIESSQKWLSYKKCFYLLDRCIHWCHKGLVILDLESLTCAAPLLPSEDPSYQGRRSFLTHLQMEIQNTSDPWDIKIIHNYAEHIKYCRVGWKRLDLVV